MLFVYIIFDLILTNKLIQKAAHETLDHHRVMIGDLRLMLLPMVQVTHYLGMVLVVTVDVTVIHLKMATQSQDQILAVDGHQIGCLLLLHNLVQDIR